MISALYVFSLISMMGLESQKDRRIRELEKQING